MKENVGTCATEALCCISVIRTHLFEKTKKVNPKEKYNGSLN